MLILIATFTFGIAIPFVVFTLFKSTKEYPRTWREFVIEIKAIKCGYVSQNQDLIYLRHRNRIKLIPFTSKKICVITGGNRGIGIEVVKKMVRCNVTVVMGVRNTESSRRAVEDYLGEEANGKVFYEKCDTGDMTSVREFAAKVQKSYPEIHFLINNAGIMATPYTLTKDGFESQMATNHIGHFLLTHLLMPQLVAGSKNNDGKFSRIVNVSSCINKISDPIDSNDLDCKKYYYPIDSYAKSKLAQVLFTRHLDKILKDKQVKVQVHAAHPGVVDTGLFENSSASYIPWFLSLVYKTPERGSRTIVYAAISPELEGKGGEYLENCGKMRPSDVAKDSDGNKKFFDLTCDLLGIKNFGDL